MGGSCLAVRAQLEALVDGEVGERTAKLLRAHLAQCPECREHYTAAASLPGRLATLGSPEPPPALLAATLREVRRESVGALQIWGLFAAEVALVLIAAWYLSGLSGLLELAGHTAGDVAGWLSWFGGQAAVPAPVADDLFLLLICGLLVLVTLLHLALLSRRGSAPTS
jgi:predicted anti-sigma-YlaC factor YlaD